MAFFIFKRFAKIRPPVRKPLLMHPDNAPRTIKKFPAEFPDYIYIGPTVENVTHNDKRRPALVARLIRKSHAAGGALAQEEMTASLRDLADSMHPETRKATRALRAYYEKHVPLEQQEEPGDHLIKLQDAAHEATTA